MPVVHAHMRAQILLLRETAQGNNNNNLMMMMTTTNRSGHLTDITRAHIMYMAFVGLGRPRHWGSCPRFLEEITPRPTNFFTLRLDGTSKVSSYNVATTYRGVQRTHK